MTIIDLAIVSQQNIDAIPRKLTIWLAHKVCVACSYCLSSFIVHLELVMIPPWIAVSDLVPLFMCVYISISCRFI